MVLHASNSCVKCAELLWASICWRKLSDMGVVEQSWNSSPKFRDSPAQLMSKDFVGSREDAAPRISNR
jgi:hypothetical protein